VKKKSPLYQSGRGIPQSRIPPDQINQALSQSLAKDLVNVAPYVDANITSTYDARPINAIDFYRIDQVTSGANFTSSLFFTVPFGRVAILKNVGWYAPSLATANVYGVYDTIKARADILIDGIFDNQYQNILYPIADNLPVYVIAAAEQIIELRVTNTVGDAGFVAELSMYGQLLLASGSATNYEPGTKYPMPVKKVI
jgi:hypothetical protein